MNFQSPNRTLDVWIVNPYGWLPGENWRDYRSAPLSEALSARGHRVRWWISDIEHRSRRRRMPEMGNVPLPPGVTLEMLRSRHYDRNISIGRIRYERSFAVGFAKRSPALPVPDVIVLAEPALFFAGPILAYAREQGIPVVVDGIDLWPEMFHLALPDVMRGLGRAFFAPLYRKRDKVVAQAAAVVAVTGDYLERLTRRVAPALADVIYLGVDRSMFLAPDFATNPELPVEVVYAGNLGDAYDMPVLMAAIGRLAHADRPIRFTLAGAGPWEEKVADLAMRYPKHLTFVGRVPPTQLPELYAKAQIGLATYSPGSTVSMPTKLFDYLASGLATVGSMGGEAVALLHKGAGQTYQAGSVDALVSALNSYVDDRKRLTADRQFAHRIAGEFDIHEQYARYTRLIEASAVEAFKC